MAAYNRDPLLIKAFQWSLKEKLAGISILVTSFVPGKMQSIFSRDMVHNLPDASIQISLKLITGNPFARLMESITTPCLSHFTNPFHVRLSQMFLSPSSVMEVIRVVARSEDGGRRNCCVAGSKMCNPSLTVPSQILPSLLSNPQWVFNKVESAKC